LVRKVTRDTVSLRCVAPEQNESNVLPALSGGLYTARAEKYGHLALVLRS
jgi:hypothetical protein